MEEVLLTKNIVETSEFAKRLSMKIKGGDVLLLYGDLGSGKTTFTQYLAAAIGIKRKIISPTFIIMRSYDFPDDKRDLKHFYHVDLYRAQSENDIEGLGLIELLGKKENILVIEWPEKLGSRTPKIATSLYFKYIDENTREIRVKKYHG